MVSPQNGKGEKPKKLAVAVSKFRQFVKLIFAEHHASGLKTSKLHLLDHFASDIRAMGSLQHCDAGVFEYSHLLFKKSYRQTSKRRGTTMEETVKRIGHNRNIEIARVGIEQPSARSAQMKTLRPEDGVELVRDGLRLNLLDFKATCEAAAVFVKDVDGQSDECLLQSLLGIHRQE